MCKAMLLATTILASTLSLTGCLTSSGRDVPVLHQPRPSAELLQRCREPMRPARGKTLNQNGEAFVDLAAAFRECSARMDRIVDWHGEQPEAPAGPTEVAR